MGDIQGNKKKTNIPIIFCWHFMMPFGFFVWLLRNMQTVTDEKRANSINQSLQNANIWQRKISFWYDWKCFEILFYAGTKAPFSLGWWWIPSRFGSKIKTKKLDTHSQKAGSYLKFCTACVHEFYAQCTFRLLQFTFSHSNPWSLHIPSPLFCTYMQTWWWFSFGRNDHLLFYFVVVVVVRRVIGIHDRRVLNNKEMIGRYFYSVTKHFSFHR